MMAAADAGAGIGAAEIGTYHWTGHTFLWRASAPISSSRSGRWRETCPGTSHTSFSEAFLPLCACDNTQLVSHTKLSWVSEQARREPITATEHSVDGKAVDCRL